MTKAVVLAVMAVFLAGTIAFAGWYVIKNITPKIQQMQTVMP